MIAADEERKAWRRNSGNNYFIILQSFPWNISVRRKETFPRSSIVGAPCPGLGGIRGTLRNWFDGSGGFGHGSVSPAPEQTIGKRSSNGGSHRHEFQPCNPASDSEIYGHPGFKTQSTRGGWKISPSLRSVGVLGPGRDAMGCDPSRAAGVTKPPHLYGITPWMA